jgi:hypothetical protein
MVLNATFNNISAISWWSVLLEEETGVPGENHRPATSHIMLYRVHIGWEGFELTALVVIGTDWIDSYKSNYHTITTMIYIATNHWYTSVHQIHLIQTRKVHNTTFWTATSDVIKRTLSDQIHKRYNSLTMCTNNIYHGRDRMVVGFITIYSISSYHH